MVTSKHPDDACVTNSEILDNNHQNKVESDNQSSNQINKLKILKTPEALKVISINCCSLRSPSRRARLCGLLYEHTPDIIVGCESHLDNSYTSSEIFPAGFNIYRKDRTARGGGVFLAINDTLATMEEPALDANAELIWAKVNLHNSPPIYICSYYRPPHSDLQPILELNESIDKLTRKHQNCNFILAGDFNLPGIEWTDGQGTILSNPTYGYNLNETFIDVLNNHNLEQLVNSPTRQNNVLDLVFTSTPSLIEKVQTHPGMSDHEIVTFFINCKRPSINRKAPRRIYFYHKGDISGLKNELQEFQEHFIASDPYQTSVEDNWQLLKHAIDNAITKYIPSKLDRSRDKLPWINSTIKCKMKLRKHLYDKAKQTGNYTDWCGYKQVKNEVNSLLETAHRNYCSNLFNDTSKSKKKFWSYIKSIRKDNTGIAPLKDGKTT